MAIDVIALYKKLRWKKSKFDEEAHCPLILKIMLQKGRYTAFCTEVHICETTFYEWVKDFPIFRECYELGKMFAREEWEIEGYKLREEVTPVGMVNHKFDHWKMMGWSRFGISKNSRIKLDLDPTGNPSKHYSQLLLQAANGDFTASEIKQLMEAVNIGLRTHQVFELQKEIDQLKSDLATMLTNNNGNHTVSNKGPA